MADRWCGRFDCFIRVAGCRARLSVSASHATLVVCHGQVGQLLKEEWIETMLWLPASVAIGAAAGDPGFPADQLPDGVTFTFRRHTGVRFFPEPLSHYHFGVARCPLRIAHVVAPSSPPNSILLLLRSTLPRLLHSDLHPPPSHPIPISGEYKSNGECGSAGAGRIRNQKSEISGLGKSVGGGGHLISLSKRRGAPCGFLETKSNPQLSPDVEQPNPSGHLSPSFVSSEQDGSHTPTPLDKVIASRSKELTSRSVSFRRTTLNPPPTPTPIISSLPSLHITDTSHRISPSHLLLPTAHRAAARRQNREPLQAEARPIQHLLADAPPHPTQSTQPTNPPTTPSSSS